MQDRFKYTDRFVITFVIAGLLLLVTFTALVLIKNKTLTNKVYYQTILDNASGLSSKPPIYFRGFQIGSIDDFELVSATNDILVRFYIYENYTDKIIKYAVISRVEGLVPGASNQYELLLPHQDLVAQLKPLREGELVPFINSDLGQEYAKKGRITVKLDSLESILASTNSILLNLQNQSNPESGEVFQIMQKVSTIADSFLVIAQQVEEAQFAPEIRKTIISLQTLIETSNSTVAKAEDTITSTNQLIRNADGLTGEIDLVLKSYENPVEIISGATENKLPGMIENVDENLLILKDILKEVHLQREQLAIAIVTLNNTLKIFDKTLQGVNSNPLIKEGIEPDNKANYSIEVNEN